jgi:eukaryotic-like serine/threonine-protein kinase
VEDPVTTDEPQPKIAGDLAAQVRAKDLIGRVISDRYRIAELLAMGGMGAVYRGEHVLLKKRIAIKILHPDIENLPELVTRFEREAIVGAHIQHPNVAVATDFGKLDDGSFFLVLEYVRGQTLYHAIRKGPLVPRRVVHIGRQIASALHAVHGKGVVHRDVKPRNVMLLEGQNDLAKLIDFGLAKVSVEQLTVADSLRSSRVGESERRARGSDSDKRGSTNEAGDRLTGVGVIFGTIAYLAPEAALGMDAVDARADLYALGLILYEMVTGKHPFPATDAIELFKHQRYTPPPPFSEQNPNVSVPSALESVVMRLLEKDPAARYQTARELIRALDGLTDLATEPPSIEIVSPEISFLAEQEGEAEAAPAPRVEAEAAPAPPDEAEAAPSSKISGLFEDALPPSEPPTSSPLDGRDTTPPPARRVGAADLKRRRPPYFLGAILITIAAGLFMFTRLRAPLHPPPAPLPPRPAGETLSGETAPTEARPRATVEPPALVEPSAPPSATPLASRPDDAPDAAATALVGVDASGLRAIVIQAARSRDWESGEAALLALVDRDPASFSRAEVFNAARDVVVGLERDDNADKVFDAIVGRLGDRGLDLLYELVESKGGSRAATRAAELLRKDELKARESPAIRIALELREAPCVDKLKLLDRAVKDGDGRALVVLQTQGVACFRKSRELDRAMSALKSKLIKQ